MQEWCIADINYLLNSNDLLPLCEKKICRISDDKEYYVNAFEYGLFSTLKDCTRLSNALHTLGFISSDMVTPFIVHAAASNGYEDHYIELVKIYWSKEVLLGLMKRPDAGMMLTFVNKINGYEFALTDKQLSRKVGKLIFDEDIRLSNVIHYEVFKNAPCEHIKELFSL